MSLFGPKKTPEEKQKELEEIQAQIDEMEQKKKSKKNNKKTRVIPLDEEKQEKVSSNGLSYANVNEIREKRQKRKDQSREVFVQRIANHKINETRQSQEYKEIISRLTKEDLSKIIHLLHESKDIFDFYSKGVEDFDPKVFIALDIISLSEQTLFDYLYRNNLSDELYQGEVALMNKAYIQSQKEKYQEFADKHQEMISSIKSGSTQFYDDRLSKLPRLYILGDERSFELVKAMSIPTSVRPIFNFDDLEIFKYDEEEKCVILFESVNGELQNDYQKIKNEQNFKILLAFNLSSDQKMHNEVVPFNRDNLISKLI